jgi:hypothetical protein
MRNGLGVFKLLNVPCCSCGWILPWAIFKNGPSAYNQLLFSIGTRRARGSRSPVGGFEYDWRFASPPSPNALVFSVERNFKSCPAVSQIEDVLIGCAVRFVDPYRHLSFETLDRVVVHIHGCAVGWIVPLPREASLFHHQLDSHLFSTEPSANVEPWRTAPINPLTRPDSNFTTHASATAT